MAALHHRVHPDDVIDEAVFSKAVWFLLSESSNVILMTILSSLSPARSRERRGFWLVLAAVVPLLTV